MVANMIEIHGSLAWVAATHNSTIAINIPAKGVHSLTRKKDAGARPNDVRNHER
jgi:hypothetical protein